MEEDTQYFQHIILHYFKKGKYNLNAKKKKIYAVYGEGAVTVKSHQKWFVKFLGTTDLLAK